MTRRDRSDPSWKQRDRPTKLLPAVLAHILLSGGVSKLPAPTRSVEVFIVDAPRAAAQALGAHRPTAESTHVLCRHADESVCDFQKRVLDRTERISACRRIRAVWYVVGSESVGAESIERHADPASECVEPLRALPMLQTLVPMLETGASLTVIGPGTHQGAVFEWLDSLTPKSRSRVTVRPQLDSNHAPTVAGAQPRRAPLRSSPVSVAAPLRTHEAEMPLAESA
jgi:hypothetical protein